MCTSGPAWNRRSTMWEIHAVCSLVLLGSVCFNHSLFQVGHGILIHSSFGVTPSSTGGGNGFREAEHGGIAEQTKACERLGGSDTTLNNKSLGGLQHSTRLLPRAPPLSRAPSGGQPVGVTICQPLERQAPDAPCEPYCTPMTYAAMSKELLALLVFS